MAMGMNAVTPLPACDLAWQLELVLRENVTLTRELGRVQCRVSRFAQEQADRIRALESEVVRLRGRLIRSQTENACLQARRIAPQQPLAAALPPNAQNTL